METEPAKSKSLLGRLNHHKAVIAALVVLVAGLFLLIIPAWLQLSGSSAEVTKQLASVLIPSGLIALIYEMLLRRTFLTEMQEQLEHALRRAIGPVEGMRAAGLVGIHEELSNDHIANCFRNAHESIQILQTWIGNYISIESSLEKAAERGCRVQILLLDPSSPQAAARGKDLGWSDEDVADEIKRNIKQLAALCARESVAKHIELRLYDATPVMTLYWYDETCYVGFFWRMKKSIAKPQLEVSMRGFYLGAEIKSHFSDLWESAKKVDLAALKSAAKE